jgi:hypothetical protein
MNSDAFEDWLSLEQCEFVGHIYDLTMPIQLGGHDYDTLLTIAPDRAYVLDVHDRISRLVDRFNSLNMIFQMLAIENFPLASRRGPIPREDWVRIILDVLLVRLTSIRDCTYLLVAEVFELGMDPRNVSRKTLRKNPSIPSDPFHGLIDDFANLGRAFRDERDLHLHRAEERSLGADPITYRIASIFESWGNELTGTDKDGGPIDLRGKHQKIVEEIEKEFSSSARDLERKLFELFEALYPVFLQKFRAKRRLSQLD